MRRLVLIALVGTALVIVPATASMASSHLSVACEGLNDPFYDDTKTVVNFGTGGTFNAGETVTLTVKHDPSNPSPYTGLLASDYAVYDSSTDFDATVTYTFLVETTLLRFRIGVGPLTASNNANPGPAFDMEVTCDATGTVEGAVYFDGEPLPDVEVFLGTGGPPPLHTCTDSNGRFKFTDVPAGVTLVSATGPAVALPCPNSDFLSPTGSPLRTQYYDHNHGRSSWDTFSVDAGETMHVQFDVFRETDNIGMVDTSQGLWHLRPNLGKYESPFFYGNPGDAPFVGDWDCNGSDTPGLYRQSDGFAYLRNSNSQGVADVSFFFGDPGDVPLAGDFNDDGCDTLSIYRPSNQTFYIINALGDDGGGLGQAEFSFVFGNPGDKPFVGDFDGDGIDEVGLHRESTGFVYYRETLTTGNADNEFFFGDPGDRFVAGEFLLDLDNSTLGYDSPAVFRPSNTTWYFKRSNSQGNADLSLVYGQASWIPVGGFWAWPELNPGDSKNCTDFMTQPEAQGWHDFFFPFFGDVAGLDTEADGIACEGLPATTGG